MSTRRISNARRRKRTSCPPPRDRRGTELLRVGFFSGINRQSLLGVCFRSLAQPAGTAIPRPRTTRDFGADLCCAAVRANSAWPMRLLELCAATSAIYRFASVPSFRTTPVARQQEGRLTNIIALSLVPSANASRRSLNHATDTYAERPFGAGFVFIIAAVRSRSLSPAVAAGGVPTSSAFTTGRQR